ncbi:MAG: hypothetical protein ACKVGT_10615, partial [Flavobacteriales bacterium]
DGNYIPVDLGTTKKFSGGNTVNVNSANISTTVDGLTAVTASFSTTGSNTFAGNQTILSSNALTLQPSDPLPSGAGVVVGSMAVTGSTLAFYNGIEWMPMATGSF